METKERTGLWRSGAHKSFYQQLLNSKTSLKALSKLYINGVLKYLRVLFMI